MTTTSKPVMLKYSDIDPSKLEAIKSDLESKGYIIYECEKIVKSKYEGFKWQIKAKLAEPHPKAGRELVD